MTLRSTINSAASSAADLLGVNAILRRAHRHQLLVLCYHGVVTEVPPGDEYFYRNAVPARLFDAQMKHVARHFRPVSATQVLASLDGGAALPERAVLVSFDDGYRNNLTIAAPILARHGIPAMVAITTDRIGDDGLLWPTEVDLRVLRCTEPEITAPDGSRVPVPPPGRGRELLAARIRGACKRLGDDDRRAYVDGLRHGDLPETDDALVGFLSWDEVRQLHSDGFTIASHTRSHPILSRTDEARLRDEVAESKRRIEAELSAPCDCFVYPNGGAEDVSAATRTALEEAGYRAAFTLCGAPNPSPLPRLDIDRLSVPCHAGLAVWASHVSGLRRLV